MNSAGVALGLKKSEFVKPKITFVGYHWFRISYSVDPGKIYLKEPETKRQLKQIIGFF